MIDRKGIVLDLDDLHEAWPELLQRAGVNVLGIHNWSGDNRFSEKIDEMVAYARSAEGGGMLEAMQKRGIEIEYELHAMSWLLPREWFSRFPEWFRMDEQGNRTPLDNMCPSNEEALEVVGKNAVKLAKLLSPTTDRYYLWPDDNKPWCLCDKCRDYSASDQTLIVNNAIVEAIRSIRGDAKLSHLAYTFTLEAPPVRVKPKEGIFLEMAGPIIHRPKEQRGVRLRDDEKFCQALADHLQVFDVNEAQALEYWLDLSFFCGWKKPAPRLELDAERAEDDVSYYKELGFRSITTFGVFLDRDYFARYGEPPVVEYASLLK